MIHALLQYAEDRGLVSKPGYAKKTIKWILNFDELASMFTGLVSSDREFLLAPDLLQPELLALGAQKGHAAHFLIASLGTFLGWGKDAASEQVEVCKHNTLVWMFQEAGETDPCFIALTKLLTNKEILDDIREKVMSFKNPLPKPHDLATVRFGDRFPADEDTWHEWWDVFRAHLKKPVTDQNQMACFGTGEIIKPEKTHPKIKKLSGVGLSQPHAPIITFDKAAFESYGLAQGENAAMDSETSNAYVNAIDRLLEQSVVYSWRRSKSGTKKELTNDYAKLGGARIAYWYTGPANKRVEVEEQCDLIAITLGSNNKENAPLEDDEEEKIITESRLKKMIDRLRLGVTAQDIGAVRFCILAFSGAGGRVMVRDFIEGSVLHLAEITEQWFKDLSLSTYWGRLVHPPGLEQILTAPLADRRNDQDYLKWVAPAGAWRQAMWRAALTGGRIPDTAFERSLLAHNNMVVRGDLVDEKEGPTARRRSHLRLALVKAHLIRKGITMKAALDPEHPSSAYHCGRLLAVYDSLQREALGDVGAGVIQRYYRGALTNPVGVFGQLSWMAQTHLSKLEGGLAHVYISRIAEIHNGIRREGDSPASYPPALSLNDQALFALGFWHQIAATNKEITDAVNVKKMKEEGPKNGQDDKKENIS